MRRKATGPKAKQDIAALADRLAARFLEGGNYAFSGPLSGSALKQILPAAAAGPSVEHFFEEVGFSGLAVQSVGYEEGTDEPKIHVYVVKGARGGKGPHSTGSGRARQDQSDR